MANINTGPTAGGGSSGSTSGDGGDFSLTREDLGLVDSGGSDGGGGGSTQQSRDPFEGAQTGSDVFRQGQTVNPSSSSGGDTGGTSDSSGANARESRVDQPSDSGGQQDTQQSESTQQTVDAPSGARQAVRRDQRRSQRRQQERQGPRGAQRAVREDRQRSIDQQAQPQANRSITTGDAFTPGVAADSDVQQLDVGGAQQTQQAQSDPTLGDVGESLVDDPMRSIERGGTASEFGRNVAAGGLGFAFQNPDELNTGIDIEGRGGNTALSGPGVTNLDPTSGPLFETGEQGELNTDVTDRLTEGRGLFPDTGGEGFFATSEEELRGRVDQRQEFFGVGEELAGITPDAEIFDGVSTSDVAEGVGRVPGDVAAAPSALLLGGDLAAEGAANLPGTVGEFGVGETAGAIAETGGRATGGAVRAIEREPGQFAGALAGGLFGGSVAANVLEGGTTAARVRVEGRGGPDIDATETTRQPETLESGNQPTFETNRDQPGFLAAQEMRERAAENPPELQEATGSEQVLFRSESERLPGEISAQEGSFELPGLFASGDFPPLRTDVGGGRFSSPSVRLPRIFGEPQRTSAFEAPDIDAMPETATGSGFGVRSAEGELIDTFPDTGEGAATARGIAEDVGGERVPDPTTPGAKFLQEQGERGSAFVRPSGSRTNEFEAIFPPETEFRRVTTGTIDVGGDRGTLDIFQLADDQPAVPGGDVPEGGLFTAGEISRRSSGGTPEGAAVTPVPVFGPSGTAAGTTAQNNTSTQPTQTSTSPVGGTSAGGGGGLPEGMFGGGTRRDSSGPGSSTRPTDGGPSGPFGFPGGSTGGSGGSSRGGGSGTSVFDGPTTAPSGGSGGGSGLPGIPGGSGGSGGGPPSNVPPSFGGGPSGGPPSGGPPTSGGSPGGGSPFGGPSGGSPFGFSPAIFGGGGTPTQPRGRPDRDSDDDETGMFGIGPTGSEFENPVASGGEFLFGGGAMDFGVGGSAGENTRASADTEAVFGGGFGGMGDAEALFGGTGDSENNPFGGFF